MAKQEKLTELYTPYPDTGGKLEQRGPVVPVKSYGKTLYHLQDGQRLPSWLVWLRRRRGVVLALLALAGVAYATARLIGGTK